MLIERSLASRPAFRTGFRCVQRASRRHRPSRVRRRRLCYARVSVRERYEASGAALSGPAARSARGNARRRCASSKHAWLGCRYAPRPGCRAWGSGTMTPPAATRRSRLDLAARSLHPTHVRTGKLPGAGCSDRTTIPHISLPCPHVQGTWRDPGAPAPRPRRTTVLSVMPEPGIEAFQAYIMIIGHFGEYRHF